MDSPLGRVILCLGWQLIGFFLLWPHWWLRWMTSALSAPLHNRTLDNATMISRVRTLESIERILNASCTHWTHLESIVYALNASWMHRVHTERILNASCTHWTFCENCVLTECIVNELFTQWTCYERSCVRIERIENTRRQVRDSNSQYDTRRVKATMISRGSSRAPLQCGKQLYLGGKWDSVCVFQGIT